MNKQVTSSKFLGMVPVLPSSDIELDTRWYEENTGFSTVWKDEMYAVLRRGDWCIHLQWHADTEDDPLLGGSVIRIFVDDIHSFFEEMVDRGTVGKEKLRLNTPWGTHEFGFFDRNRNAVFFVEDSV